MPPWINREALIRSATDFAQSNGYFLRSYANRISGLVEIAVYNSVLEYYKNSNYTLQLQNLGPKQSFRYKSSPAGLIENFSFFIATHSETGDVVSIVPNTKIQSAHHEHLYYSPDVVICSVVSAITVPLQNGKRHSYIENTGLITFIEVKHLTPFPEILFSFTGLLLEFSPAFVFRRITTSKDLVHLTPSIVFTGVASSHVRTIQTELTQRYKINIIYNTQATNGSIVNINNLLKYSWTLGMHQSEEIEGIQHD